MDTDPSDETSSLDAAGVCTEKIPHFSMSVRAKYRTKFVGTLNNMYQQTRKEFLEDPVHTVEVKMFGLAQFEN